MSIKVNTRPVGDVTVIEVIGRITIGDGSVALREAVRETVARGRMKIVINMAEVPYIDSSGIGELVQAYSTVTKGGGQFKLSNLTKRVQDLLKISKHDMLFDIHEQETGAVQSFSAGA